MHTTLMCSSLLKSCPMEVCARKAAPRIAQGWHGEFLWDLHNIYCVSGRRCFWR